MKDFSYIGSGKVFLGVLTNNSSGPLYGVGNVSKLALSIAEDKKELIDYRTPGGGLQNSVIRIKSVGASLTMHDFSPTNFEIAVRGMATNVASGAVVNESKIAHKDALVLFDFVPIYRKPLP